LKNSIKISEQQSINNYKIGGIFFIAIISVISITIFSQAPVDSQMVTNILN
jgi:hypothetical protein